MTKELVKDKSCRGSIHTEELIADDYDKEDMFDNFLMNIYMNVDIVKNIEVPKRGINTKVLSGCIGVYVLKSETEVLYVGETKDIDRRLGEHALNKDFAYIDIYFTDSNFDAKILERFLIKRLRPSINEEIEIYQKVNIERVKFYLYDMDRYSQSDLDILFNESPDRLCSRNIPKKPTAHGIIKLDKTI